MQLSKSMEHYIKTIYDLNPCGEGARVSDIAARLNITKSSVCTAVKVLKNKGLVQHNHYSLVWLTKEGPRQARIIKTKYNIIKQFLTKILGIEEKTAGKDACEFEHILSLEVIEALRDMANFQSCFCLGLD